MRIIAGKCRSMPLKTIPGRDTRPTTDRIKETLFNMIQAYIPECYFLDLFAGSGAIGLEAASRGAAKTVFVENSKKACDCIDENIRFTGLVSSCDLKRTDVMAGLGFLEGRYVFDVIFMDPPYQSGMSKDVMKYLEDSSLAGADTLVIVEESAEFDPGELESPRFMVIRVKKYKTNQHIFLMQRKDYIKS